MEIPTSDIDVFSRRIIGEKDPKPWMTTIGHGPVELPVRIRPL
jgi:hypothetical protein